MSTPKLRRENLAAAYATVAFLIKNPGTKQKDVHIFINSQKDCLRGVKRPMHYMNYQNILRYLFDKDMINTLQSGKSVLYYAKTF